jgi:hypothetical protein
VFQIKKEKETTNNTNTHSKTEILSPVISEFIPKEKERKRNVSSVSKSKKKNQKETKKQMQILTSKPKSRVQVRP